MRRFALTLLASLSVVALSACSGYGGTAIGNGSSSSFDRLIFETPASGANSVFKVAPLATSPLFVSVYGSKSNFSIIQADTTATWQVTYAVGSFPAPYVGINTAVGNITCTAPAATSANPSAALVVQASGVASTVTYTPGTYYQTIGINPPGITAVAPNTVPVAPYCLNVVATATNGMQGSFVVLVSN
ncbi:MAG: hypothetical protein JO359_04810 [Candidatus Eremiobacteraeota bacterium]|nr:hypothetical protein [Candidatus Eremiobacteraeota bacterium]